jgi:aspartyl-tRNA(Asn)/glutamyl-tRNA(Gln) amidotransferase subunit B
VDANVSARPFGQQAFNTRTEIKNVNSFSNVERALELEFARHCAVHDAGGTVVQQTMLFDAAADEVRAARSKEGSHDYRYFPEPDLPPLVLTDAFVAASKVALPEFPSSRRARYQSSFGLATADVEVLTATRDVGDWFEAVVARCGDGKAAANWVMGEVLAALNESGGEIAAFPVLPAQLGDLIALVKSDTISNTAGKKVFAAMLTEGGEPKAIAERLGLLQVGDDSALDGWIDEVMAEHPEEAARFTAGERKLQGVLIGFVMKKSGGRADPKKLAQMLGKRVGG